MKHEEASSGKIRAIILEPTRELALQVQEQIEKFSSLKSVLFYGGGESKSTQCKWPQLNSDL